MLFLTLFLFGAVISSSMSLPAQPVVKQSVIGVDTQDASLAMQIKPLLEYINEYKDRLDFYMDYLNQVADSLDNGLLESQLEDLLNNSQLDQASKEKIKELSVKLLQDPQNFFTNNWSDVMDILKTNFKSQIQNILYNFILF